MLFVKCFQNWILDSINKLIREVTYIDISNCKSVSY